MKKRTIICCCIIAFIHCLQPASTSLQIFLESFLLLFLLQPTNPAKISTGALLNYVYKS